ncbi:amino acid adenylation domain-containing protein, partial [Marinobacter sp. NFXS9]|uniref:non-ribosomal peptide synthetase n=1 Tax=Marinobacter sp. NFXS9 TaxID=2818433 RepID=UPI0032DF4BCB
KNPLPPLAIQYADYASWQRTVLDKDRLSTQLDYWREQLEDAPALLTLPLDHPRPGQQDYVGGSIELELGPELTGQLKRVAQAHGLTLHMLLLSAWSLLLSRLSGQETVVIGTPVANRPRAELEELIGFFVNTLAIRIDVSSGEGELTVAQFFDRVKAQALGAYAHQDAPFEQVVEELQPGRSLNHSPLFQVMFAFQNTPKESELELSGMTLSGFEGVNAAEQGQAQFDLSLTLGESLREGGAVLVGELNYAYVLFNHSTIERWIVYLKTLLTNIAETSTMLDEQPLHSLSMLPKAEREQLLYGFNDTTVSYPQDRCIHELFEAQAERRPDAIALVFGEQQLTYRQLNEKANQLAHRLVAEGVKPDSLVGLCVERSLEMVIGLLGILKAGGAYVPIDPVYPAERIEYMLSDSGVSWLLTQQALKGCLPTDDRQRVLYLDEEGTYAEQPTVNPEPETLGLRASHLAYVIYTSGSTGQPKGVMIEHEGAVNHCLAMVETLDLNEEDTIAQTAGISFDISVWQSITALLIGGKVLVVSVEKTQDASKLFSVIHDEGVTVLQIVPAILRAFAQIKGNTLTLNQLRWLSITGEAFPKDLGEWWLKNYPKIPMLNAYGPAECSDDVTLYTVRSLSEIQGGQVPIGSPISNTQVYVLSNTQALLSYNVVGELHVGGVGLARGYLNRPELTAERFIANPFHDPSNPSSSERLYRTGDLARWLPDGNLEFLGRNDHQVKIRGCRIELGEVEAQLQRLEQVKEAVVVAHTVEATGDKQLVGYITPAVPPAEGEELDLFPIRRELKATLPEYMVPSALIVL